MRRRYSLRADALCQTCGWRNTAKNAHGSGAQHAKKHNHHVTVEVYATHSYNAPEAS